MTINVQNVGDPRLHTVAQAAIKFKKANAPAEVKTAEAKPAAKKATAKKPAAKTEAKKPAAKKPAAKAKK